MYMRLFHLENLFVTCSCSFIVFFFLEIERTEVGGEAEGKMHGL